MITELNMIDYIDFLETKVNILSLTELDLWQKTRHHKDFLKSTPKLGDFVPTNEKGEVMEKPDKFDDWLKEPIRNGHFPLGVNCEKFQQALDRVIWKGWEVVEGETKYHLKKPNEGSRSLLAYVNKTHPKAFELLNEILGNKTYEQLITSGVKLERIEKK